MRLCEIVNWIALVVRGRRDTKFPRSRLRGSHLDVLSPFRPCGRDLVEFFNSTGWAFYIKLA